MSGRRYAPEYVKKMNPVPGADKQIDRYLEGLLYSTDSHQRRLAKFESDHLAATGKPVSTYLTTDDVREAVDKLRQRQYDASNPWQTPWVTQNPKDAKGTSMGPTIIRPEDVEKARLSGRREALAAAVIDVTSKFLPTDDSDPDVTAFNDGLRTALLAIKDALAAT